VPALAKCNFKKSDTVPATVEECSLLGKTVERGKGDLFRFKRVDEQFVVFGRDLVKNILKVPYSDRGRDRILPTEYNIDTNYGGTSIFKWLQGLSNRNGLFNKTVGQQSAVYDETVFKPVLGNNELCTWQDKGAFNRFTEQLFIGNNSINLGTEFCYPKQIITKNKVTKMHEHGFTIPSEMNFEYDEEGNLVEKSHDCRNFVTVHRTNSDEMDFLFKKKHVLKSAKVRDQTFTISPP